MPTVPERLAALETQGKEHEGRHARFEDRIERFSVSVEDRLDGISRHVAGIEAQVTDLRAAMPRVRNGSGRLADTIRDSAPKIMGGAGIGAALLKALEAIGGG